MVVPYVRDKIAMTSRMSSPKIYPSGRGTGTQNFTIASGHVTVDQILIQMWAVNQPQSQFQFEPQLQSDPQSLYLFAGLPLAWTSQSKSPYLFEAFIPVRYEFHAR